MVKSNVGKLIILVMLTNLLMPLNFAMASCDWSLIERKEDKFLYPKECHHRVGILLENEEDYKIQVNSLRKTIELKDLTIKDLQGNSDMWEKEAKSQFERFEKYREAEDTRTLLWFGGGVGATVLLIFLTSQATK